MDNIKSVWILLSSDAASCCNEPYKISNTVKDLMPLEMFKRIAAYATEKSWDCTVLCNDTPLPKDYEAVCRQLGAKIIQPSDCRKGLFAEGATIAFEPDDVANFTAKTTAKKAILRITQRHLPQLAEIVSKLLENFNDISIKHPEQMRYKDQDMAVYREQLKKISTALLNKKEAWHSYRVDVLTDRFHIDSNKECGAAITNLAIAPDGKLFICPAEAREGTRSCGDMFGELRLPNVQLYTRGYSVPCGKCDALHCIRCVYLNKRATYEYCVPPSNLCRLANLEQEAQALLEQEAVKKGLWDEKYNAPALPTIYDPFEMVKSEEAPIVSNAWRRLVRFDNNPEHFSSAAMLDVVHGLHGWCQALTACAKVGKVPTVECIEKDKLLQLRRSTTEKYRQAILQKDCPSVFEVELAMCRAANKADAPQNGVLV